MRLLRCALAAALAAAPVPSEAWASVAPAVRAAPGAIPAAPVFGLAGAVSGSLGSGAGRADLTGRNLSALGAPGLPGPTNFGSPLIRAAGARPHFGELTGAITRTAPDPGPVRKMWFVYDDPARIESAEAALALIRADNPGVEIVPLHAPAVVPGDDEARAELSRRFEDEGVEFVLASGVELYEEFRVLRDKDLARKTAFGFLGKDFVSVDSPRASLDPARLSDPRRFPHRRYLVLSKDGPSRPAAPVANMEGISAVLSEVLAAPDSVKESKPWAAKLKGLLSEAGNDLLLRLSGQGENRSARRLRRGAVRAAANLKARGVDALAIDAPESAAIVGLMKRMGHLTSLPVIWTGEGAPGDASGINLSLSGGAWLKDAPHVRLSAKPDLATALAEAPGLERLPGNFMEMGGPSVPDFEAVARDAVARAMPPSPEGSAKVYDVHFLLTYGNGVERKGDRNAFGHFGMAVTDDDGTPQVWTVQYEDGGTFTGGLGPGKQTTLGEYLYANWYLPGATGQTIPLGQTGEAPVLDFILRSVDAAAVEAMRHMAAAINARHLLGKDNYSFTNRGGMTNCISMVTQILRAAGFRIAESGIQAPADKAVELISALSRELLKGTVRPEQMGFVLFDRPAHASSAEYRVNNVPLGSPMVTRAKPWSQMSLIEKARRVLGFPLSFFEGLLVPRTIEAFARMAGHLVTVAPNSRRAIVTENPDSPLLRMRAAAGEIASLRESRVGLMRSLAALEAEILAEIGYEGWRRNPERERAMTPEERARLAVLREKHLGLEVDLALNNFDEQLRGRLVEFLKLRLADPRGRLARRLRPVEAAYRKVLAVRDRIARERRVLTPAELEALQVLNAKVEGRLHELRGRLLADAGPEAPSDLRMIFRQVTMDSLDRLIKP